MTELLIIETGEVIQLMTAEEASSVTTRIAVKLDAIGDNYEAVMPLIRDAITRQAHAALGYRSPGEYVADRFGSALSRLGAEMRRGVVQELSAAGLSTRAIAPVVGVSQMTAVRDISAGETYVSPDRQGSPEEREPAPITGIDGKTYQRPPTPASAELDPSWSQEEREAILASRRDMEERAAHESVRRATTTNLRSVLIYLTSTVLTPERMAETYDDVLTDFSLEELTYAAQTMTFIAQKRSGNGEA